MTFSCFGSIALLGGTIYWVRQMTLTTEAGQLQASALNLYTVFGHILLLVAQSIVVFFNVIAFSTQILPDSLDRKIFSTINVSSALVDIYVCCLICF